MKTERLFVLVSKLILLDETGGTLMKVAITKKFMTFLSVVVIFLSLVPVVSVPRSVSAVSLGDGTTYYIDSDNGNDSNDGRSTKRAWKTLDKVNSTTFKPGDNILLKADGVWEDQYLWPKGQGEEENPITIGRYGEGSDPCINTNGSAPYAVRLRDQEYMTIQNLEITNHSDISLASTTGMHPYEDDESVEGYVKLMPFGSSDFYVGILVTITAGKEEDYVCHGITIRDNYIHDVNGMRFYHSTVIGGRKELTYARAQSRGGFNTDLWKCGGGISVTTEDPRERQTADTTSNKGLYGIPVGETNGSPSGANKPDNLKKATYDGLLIDSNHIEDVSETGIRVTQSMSLRAYNNNAGVDDPTAGFHKNVVIRNNTVNGNKRWSDFGIYWAATDGALVEHNSVSGFHTSGMEDTHCQFSIVQYNEIYDINHDFSDKGDLTQTADSCAMDSDGSSHGTIWQYNYAHDNRDGLLFCVWTGKAAEQPTIYRYNIVTNTSGRLVYGTHMGYLYNNTFYNALDTGTVTISSGQTAINNIFFLPSGDGKFSGTVDHNLYAGGLKAPSKDVNAIVGDPQFIDPGKDSPYTSNIAAAAGYQLKKSSPAIDQGTILPELPEDRRNKDYNAGLDYFGNELYSGLPDIGAHEYSEPDKPVPTDVNLSSYRMYLVKGETRRLTADLDSAIFNSLDSEIAQVNSKGEITAISEGETTIQVTTKEGPKAQCTVTVTSDSLEPAPSTRSVIATDDTFVRTAQSLDTPMGIATNAFPAGSLTSKYCLYTHHANKLVNGARYGMIQFDLSSIQEDSVPEAKVRLYLNAIMESTEVKQIGLFETAPGWSENTLTWNNVQKGYKPCGAIPVAKWTGKIAPGSTAQKPLAVREWVEFDITDFINKKLSDGETQISFALAPTDMITDAFIKDYSTGYVDQEGRKQFYQFVTKEFVPNGGKAGDCAPHIEIPTGQPELESSTSFTTQVGIEPILPSTIKITKNNVSSTYGVKWEKLKNEWFSKKGSFEVKGTVADCPEIPTVIADVTVEEPKTPASPTSVVVSPNNADVFPGTQKQFEAFVNYGSDNGNKEVEWEISGEQSMDTNISSEGLLTVGKDETAKYLTVIASSKADHSVKSSAKVVISKAALEFCREEVVFDSVPVGYTEYPDAQFVEIRNVGEGIANLSYTIEGKNKDYFRVSEIPYTLVPNETTMLAVHIKKGLPIGDHAVKITAISNGQKCDTVDFKITVTDGSEKTATPIAEETVICKDTPIQAAVDFNIKNGVSGKWKIYKTKDDTMPWSTINADYNEKTQKLTLSALSLNLFERDYYVSLTEPGKTESERVKLTVCSTCYNVMYDFVSTTEGKKLPLEVKALIPKDENKYKPGAIVKALPLAQTIVTTEDGVWEFMGWDEDSKAATSNLTFIGRWRFEPNVISLKLTGIKVTPPEKIIYEVGEKMDLSGMKVLAQYSDGSEKDVTKEAEVSGYDKEQVGKQTITISYKEYQETFIVEVVKDREGETSSDISKPDTSVPNTSTSGDNETSDMPTTGDMALPIIIVTGLLALISVAGGIAIWRKKRHMTK